MPTFLAGLALQRLISIDSACFWLAGSVTYNSMPKLGQLPLSDIPEKLTSILS